MIFIVYAVKLNIYLKDPVIKILDTEC